MTTHIYLPTVSEIAAIFDEECRALGALSVDSVQHEQRLFARAVCGPAELVCPGDEVRGGVALHVDGLDICFHPYVLRQVCVNGAVMPIVQGMTRLERIATEEIVSSSTFAGGVSQEVREAIRSCSTASRLSNAADQMRAMTDMHASVSIAMLMQLIDAGGLPEHFLIEVLERHSSSEDASAFGVVNAVTSVARDTQDPAMRWELESIGGKLISQSASLLRAHARRESILVGA